MKLTRKQLESLLVNPTLDRRGNDLNADCPWCGHSEFGISLNDGHPFNCYRKSKCGAVGNIYTLLKKLGRVREFLTDIQVNAFERLESNLGVKEGELDLSMPEIKPPFLWKRVKDDPYLRERGFAAQQFEKFEVGRSRLRKEYVTFLVRRNGVLVGYIGRSDRSKEWIDNYNRKQKEIGSDLVYLRYNNSLDTEFSKTLFGYDEIVEGVTESVILVEGIFSKTKTDLNLGLDDQDELKCCATFGAKFSDEQLELLRIKGVRNLFFWFEADVLNKIKPILARASSYFNVRASYLNGADPNDIDSEQAYALLENSKNWLDFNKGYVSINLK